MWYSLFLIAERCKKPEELRNILWAIYQALSNGVFSGSDYSYCILGSIEPSDVNILTYLKRLKNLSEYEKQWLNKLFDHYPSSLPTLTDCLGGFFYLIDYLKLYDLKLKKKPKRCISFTYLRYLTECTAHTGKFSKKCNYSSHLI